MNNNHSSLIDNQLRRPSAIERGFWIDSTPVENPLQMNLCFLQNKPNFPRFSPENKDFTQKQTQYKANSNPIKANFATISTLIEVEQIQFKTNLVSVLCHPYSVLSEICQNGTKIDIRKLSEKDTIKYNLLWRNMLNTLKQHCPLTGTSFALLMPQKMNFLRKEYNYG